MCVSEPDYQPLIRLFNRLFLPSYNTELVAGGDEPIYRPADRNHPHHRVIFAHGFYASALHEIAHWCVAGPERRLLEDFGYWYKPDGRSAAEQAEFERVEVRPQAYEWIFNRAAGRKFHFSADNLSGGIGASEPFQRAVLAEVRMILQQGLPPRVERLVAGLQQAYGTGPLAPEQFYLEREGCE
jgi:elongation factor P hydroxylase